MTSEAIASGAKRSCPAPAPSSAPAVPGVVAGSVSDTEASCLLIISEADKALAKKNEALKLSNLAITTCKGETARLSSEVNDLRESSNRWYKNPVVMFVFGAAAGTLTYVLLK